MKTKATIHWMLRLGLWLLFVHASPLHGAQVHEANRDQTVQQWVQDEPVPGYNPILSFSQPESAALDEWFSDIAHGQVILKIPFPNERLPREKIDRLAFSGLSPPQN